MAEPRKNNLGVLEEKTYAFAIRIIKAYKYLTNNNVYVLSKQLLRSGTSIGANCREAVYAQSKQDFISKLSIALKETNESSIGWNCCTIPDILQTKVLIPSMQMVLRF